MFQKTYVLWIKINLNTNYFNLLHLKGISEKIRLLVQSKDKK